MTAPRAFAVFGVALVIFLICIAVGTNLPSGTSDGDRPIPRITFKVGEGESYSSYYKGEPVGPPQSMFEIHSSPAILLSWKAPETSQELQQAFISLNGDLIGTLEIESGRNEILVDAESIELRTPEPFLGFRSGDEYRISIGTKNQPMPPDTDESLRPKNHLYLRVK